MPVIGADAPKVWVQPNTLDDVPIENVLKSKEAAPTIASISKVEKATHFPECIMVEKQGGDKLYFGHKPWVKPPAGKDTKRRRLITIIREIVFCSLLLESDRSVSCGGRKNGAFDGQCIRFSCTEYLVLNHAFLVMKFLTVILFVVGLLLLLLLHVVVVDDDDDGGGIAAVVACLHRRFGQKRGSASLCVRIVLLALPVRYG